MVSERRLEALYTITRLLRTSEVDLYSVLQTALTTTAEGTGARQGCLITFDSGGAVAHKFILGTHGDKTARYQLWQELISRGLIGYVQHGQRPIVVRDITSDARWPQMQDTPPDLRSGSAVGVPLEAEGKVYGVLALIHPEVEQFEQDTVDWLVTIMDMVGLVIANREKSMTLETESSRYRWLFEDAIVPILITDLQGYIIDLNKKAAEYLGYNREQLLRQAITTVHRMGTGPLGTDRFSQIEKGHEVVFRSHAWTAKGERLPVMVRARRLIFEQHDVIVWVEQDISSQAELEQLRQDLTAMVYHDLRGPLHNINSSFSTLRRFMNKDGHPAAKELVEIGARSTQQLSRLVESLLDIQRLEEGRAVLDSKPHSVHNLLAQAVQLMEPLIREAEQRLEFDIAHELPFVNCDLDMVMRVVNNLMENASKYTPSGGTIRLSASGEADKVYIAISDSGPGIPPHMRDQIFDKFSRVKYKDAPKGIGLGLAFCRLAVEAHGGQIWVESELQRGSSFIFTLPAVPLPEGVPVAVG
jgi:two-component system, NtrC family, sensor histidine kinase KinB